jgi:hypothetical protein
MLLRFCGHEMALVVNGTQALSSLTGTQRPTEVAGPLVRCLNVNAREWSCAWSHVKDVRVFGESVRRLVDQYSGSIGHLWQGVVWE